MYLIASDTSVGVDYWLSLAVRELLRSSVKVS